MALDGKMSFEACGININCENKWIRLFKTQAKL